MLSDERVRSLSGRTIDFQSKKASSSLAVVLGGKRIGANRERRGKEG